MQTYGTRSGLFSLPAICAAAATAVVLAIAPAVQAESTSEHDWYLEAIQTPRIEATNKRSDPIIIAVVDDGMRITHQDLTGFVWSNPKEKPNNRIDDDGNGYVDDVYGWDVSDQDNDVGAPAERPDFYHGTHIASIVTAIAKAAYGEAAADHIQIMPVKSLSDSAPHTYIKSGYQGIRYAIDAGADIIICAWGVGHITAEESAILKEAADKGILVVAASGNLPQELDQFPAAFAAVLAVGSIERDGSKTINSNYGQFVDISAPGSAIRGASSTSDDAYDVKDGTSFSTAMVATAAALVRLSNPRLTATEIEACLLSSSRPIDITKREFSAKLGAGSLDIEAAVACDLLNEQPDEVTQLVHSKGFMRAPTKSKDAFSWNIQPPGEFSGIRFTPMLNSDQAPKGLVEFRSTDRPDAEVIASYPLDAPPENIYVPGTTAYVTVAMKRNRRGPDWLLKYEAEPINFSRLYCHDTKRLGTEGIIADGSGPAPYSGNSDCKWQITAPEGKVVRIRFDSLATESQTDLIYFFNGAGTHEDIMALISGDELPPAFTSWSNEVLIWFVSDDANHGQGWTLSYSFEDPQPKQ